MNKRLENEKLAIESRNSEVAINPAMPARVFIATTDNCNLDCPMCTYTKDRGEELPFEIFQSLADELFPLAKEYHTTVAGEPLMTSYFEKIPELLLKRYIKMNLTTNGMLLTADKSRLIIPVLEDMKVSFDGAKKETFEKIRPGSDFETVIKNIESFTKVREISVYKPTLTLQSTLMLDNIRELPEVVRTANDLGANRVKAYIMVVHKPELIDQSLWFHKELANEYIGRAEEVAKSYGLKSKFPKKFTISKDHVKSGEVDFVCHFLWQEGWVEANGDVVPCCDHDGPVMGNVYKQSFSEIWNNEKYQDMRRRVNTKEAYECCKHCSLVNEFRSDGADYTYRSLIKVS